MTILWCLTSAPCHPWDRVLYIVSSWDFSQTLGVVFFNKKIPNVIFITSLLKLLSLQ
ncbi:hypothetical protein ACRRTK_000269 [Alexandromys fortis]